MLRGNTKAGLDSARLTIRLGEQNGLPSFLVQGRFYKAWFSMNHRGADGIAEMERTLTERRDLGDRWQESVLLGLLAEAYQRRGDSTAALRCLDEALGFSQRTGERHFEAELLRLKGVSLLAQGNDLRAEDHFRLAIEIASRQSAKLWELRAAIALGRLLAQRRHVTEAKEVVGASYSAFQEGLDEPDPRAARQLASELDRGVRRA